MTKIYIVVRTACGSDLVEVLGAALDETAAVALCETERDCISEVDSGRKYPAGEISADIRFRFPLCECDSGWTTGGVLDATR